MGRDECGRGEEITPRGLPHGPGPHSQSAKHAALLLLQLPVILSQSTTPFTELGTLAFTAEIA